jgi:Ca2+-transporting ATPase
MAGVQQMAEEDEKSPLEKKLGKVVVLLTWIGIGGGIVTAFVLALFRIVARVEQQNWTKKIRELIERLMIGITLFIVAVSEGLSLATTLSLGFSMKKMMNDNHFVRHMQACETMGGATIICSDKTRC